MAADDPTGAEFKAGDRVQSWAGGPVMHVITTSLQLCYCNWVDDFGALQQGTFEFRQLVHAPPAPPDPAGRVPMA